MPSGELYPQPGQHGHTGDLPPGPQPMGSGDVHVLPPPPLVQQQASGYPTSHPIVHQGMMPQHGEMRHPVSPDYIIC